MKSRFASAVSSVLSLHLISALVADMHGAEAFVALVLSTFFLIDDSYTAPSRFAVAMGSRWQT